MRKFILKDRSFAFAIRIIEACRQLQDKREYVISKQLVRSGTAVGALLREAEFAESRADFHHKLSIALKEANETLYWLLLLQHTYAKDDDNVLWLQTECNEIVSMLAAAVKKTARNS